MKTCTLSLVITALLALIAAADARADPVLPRPITAGQVSSTPSTGQLNISGDGFDLS